MTDDRDQLADLVAEATARHGDMALRILPQMLSDWLRARDAAIAAAALDEAADELDKPGALKQPLRYRPFREDAAWCNGVISAIAFLRARAVAVRGDADAATAGAVSLERDPDAANPVGGRVEALKVEPGTLNGTVAESTPSEPAPRCATCEAHSHYNCAKNRGGVCCCVEGVSDGH